MPPVNGLTAAVCAALGVSRATVERQRSQLKTPSPVGRLKPALARALSAAQRQDVLDLLHASRFADQSPAEIYATLLDEGVYHCSIRTMYRLLGQNGEVRERRKQLRHPAYQKPELLAEKPNEVWSWDITKLMGPQKWSYFYLYVILDIFSRRVVAGVSRTLKPPACSSRCSTMRWRNTASCLASSRCTPIVAAR